MNNKMLLPIVALLVFSVAAFAIDDETPDAYVDGIVYSGNSISTPPVKGASVEVTCWHDDATTALMATTDSSGFFDVVFDGEDCEFDDDVQACVGTVCSDKVPIETTFDNPLEITGVDIFNVPEFTAVALGVAAVGGVLGFVLLRKRK